MNGVVLKRYCARLSTRSREEVAHWSTGALHSEAPASFAEAALELLGRGGEKASWLGAKESELLDCSNCVLGKEFRGKPPAKAADWGMKAFFSWPATPPVVWVAFHKPWGNPSIRDCCLALSASLKISSSGAALAEEAFEEKEEEEEEEEYAMPPFPLW